MKTSWYLYLATQMTKGKVKTNNGIIAGSGAASIQGCYICYIVPPQNLAEISTCHVATLHCTTKHSLDIVEGRL